MLDRIAHWAQHDPDRMALVDPDNSLSYRQFHAAACALMRHLGQKNFRKAGIAVIKGDSIFDDWLLTIALRALGLETMCPASLADVRAMSMFKISAIVLGTETAASLRVPPEYFAVPKIVVPKSAFQADGSATDCQGASSSGGHLLVTTGTTGSPKAILYPEHNAELRDENRAVSFGFGRDTVYYASNFPLYTAVGFKNPSATWHRGGTVVLDDLSYDAPVKLPEGINSAVLIPARIGEFAGSRRVPDSLRRKATIRVSGGFLSASTWNGIKGAFGMPIEVYFASTEIIAMIMRSPVRSVEDLNWLRPEPGRIVEIVDDSGAICPPGVEGQLRVGLTAVDAQGYLGDEAATSRAFRDGYFYPGDIAVSRQDGRIRVLGRLNDVINVMGRKRASAPVEQAVLQVLSAEEVCAFSGPDRAGNDQIVIVCRRPQPLTPAERAAAEEVVRDFGPVRIVQMKEFPRRPGAMQKTDRIALRKLVFG